MLFYIIITITAIALGLFITEFFIPSVVLTIFLCVAIWLAFFGWVYLGYMMISRKRLFLFSKAILELDRTNSKYETLFILYDFIHDEENNLDVVRNAMEQVYFFPKKVIRHPEKVKKKKLYSLLIEYYLSLSIGHLQVSFFWDYDKNFFTWKWIAILLLIGATGIVGLVLFYHFIPNPNDVLYTCLYFFFGAFTLPFIAKIFGHFI